MPPLPVLDYEEVVSQEHVAKNDPKDIRSYLRRRAISLAYNSGCEHSDVMDMWSYDNRERVTRCGRL